MSTKYNTQRDVSGNPAVVGYGMEFAIEGKNVKLTPSVASNVIFSGGYGYWLAEFSYSNGATVFVDGINVATIPITSVSSGTQEINPKARRIKNGQTLSFITEDSDVYVCIKYYASMPFSN